MGYKNVTHHFLQCDWCAKEEEYDSGRDAKYALPEWLIGRTHYKTNRGESPVTLCPSCTKIYNVATQGVRTPRGVRFRAYMDTFFACENLITEATEAGSYVGLNFIDTCVMENKLVWHVFVGPVLNELED